MSEKVSLKSPFYVEDPDDYSARVSGELANFTKDPIDDESLTPLPRQKSMGAIALNGQETPTIVLSWKPSDCLNGLRVDTELSGKDRAYKD